jgi:hypothetical protein
MHTFSYGSNNELLTNYLLLVGAKDFSSSLCVETASEIHPASYSMGTGGPFPGVKRSRGIKLISSTEVKNG